MKKEFVSLMYRYTYYTLIINGIRMFQIFMSEPDKEKQCIWMEGYLQGLSHSKNLDMEFDASESTDVSLPSLFLW